MEWHGLEWVYDIHPTTLTVSRKHPDLMGNGFESWAYAFEENALAETVRLLEKRRVEDENTLAAAKSRLKVILTASTERPPA